MKKQREDPDRGELIELECISEQRDRQFPITGYTVMKFITIIQEVAHQEKMVRGKKFKFKTFLTNIFNYLSLYASEDRKKFIELEAQYKEKENG
jgi:hypothetical protein